MFINLAAVHGDDRVEPVPQCIDGLAHILGIQPLRHGREAGDVGEENGDDFALPIRGLSLGTEGGQFLAQRSERGVNHGISQRGALSLQRGNSLFEFLNF